MNRIFVISDTHFGHKRIIEFEPEKRPFNSIEEHDEELVYRWNSTVKKHDTVWHLGDVLFGVGAFETLRRLQGKKFLIMGNHDNYGQKYLSYFDKILGIAKIRGCFLTHVPIHESQIGSRCIANIHGHLHSKKMDDYRYVNVSAEQTDLAPVLLHSVIDRIEQTAKLVDFCKNAPN